MRDNSNLDTSMGLRVTSNKRNHLLTQNNNIKIWYPENKHVMGIPYLLHKHHELTLIEMIVHKHKKGVNCVVKFSQGSGNRLRPCLDRLFVTRLEERKEVEEIMNMGFLRGNTSSPTEVKNHDLPL